MSLIEINYRPEKRELRKFGLIAVLVLGAAACIAAFVFKAGVVLPAILFAIGLGIFIVSMASARATRIIYLALTFAALPIGLVVSTLLMGAFYFLILTPVGLVFRAVGRDVLNRRFEPDTKTYWLPRMPADDAERYFHQS